MHTELINKLNRLADVIEANESVHCISTCRQAAYLIQALQAENEQYKARLLIMYPTPKERLLRIVGAIYFKFWALKTKWKNRKSTGTFWNGFTRYWTMSAKQ